MSESAPKTNTPAELGAVLSRSAQSGYYYKLAVPEKNRHPQVQEKIKEVFSAEEDGNPKDVVHFDHVSGNDYMYRAFVDPARTWYGDPGREADRYNNVSSEHIEALRAGDIEREFLAERLMALELRMADIAMGVKPGTRWQRFKELTLTGRPDSWLNPMSIKKEKAFVEGRLAAIPTEEESQATAKQLYDQNEEFIRSEAKLEDNKRTQAAIDHTFNQIVASANETPEASSES